MPKWSDQSDGVATDDSRETRNPATPLQTVGSAVNILFAVLEVGLVGVAEGYGYAY